MESYPDCHCHLPQPEGSEPRSLWINSCDERDWKGLTGDKKAGSLLFLGMHPWRDFPAFPGWQKRLEEYLVSFEDFAIGEIGLDAGPRGKPFETQLEEFRFQLQLAQRFQRPVSLHIYKSWEELFRLCGLLPREIPMMIHGFLSSPQQAIQLVEKGFYLSLGPGILKKNEGWLKEILYQIPEDRILVESDYIASDISGDYQDRLKSVYNALEQSSSEDNMYWRRTIERNQSLFKNRTNGGAGRPGSSA